MALFIYVCFYAIFLITGGAQLLISIRCPQQVRIVTIVIIKIVKIPRDNLKKVSEGIELAKQQVSLS